MTMELNRRQAIGALGAFAGLGLLPSWRAFAQSRKIDLRPFCDDMVWRRWDLTKPFAQDGMVYGTDGSILCRTTLAEVPALASAEKLPAASKLPWWSADDQRWRRWPARRLFADGYKYGCICPMCSGRGCVGNVVKHAECGGDGFRPCDRDEASDFDGDLFTKDCAGCQGTGYVSDTRCDYCAGTGNTNRPSLQRIGDTVVAGHYDQMIRDLGDVEYSLVHSSDPAGTVAAKDCVVMFRGDGFEGLLIPLDMRQRV